MNGNNRPEPVVLCQDKSLDLSVRRETTDAVRLNRPHALEGAGDCTDCPWPYPLALTRRDATVVRAWRARGPPYHG